MTLRLTQSDIERLCAGPLTPLAARNAAVGLGPLARWWLSDETLDLARQGDPHELAAYLTPPLLPADVGSCVPIFVPEQPRALPLLKRAFLLPVQWRDSSPHSPFLPRGLVELAERVVQQLQHRPGVAAARWGLHLHPQCLAGLDLSGVALRCGSAWATLAGGLVLVAEGLAGRPDVWASGAWDDRYGTGQVADLEAKLALARHCGVRKFYVPVTQYPQALQLGHAADVLGVLNVMPRPQPDRVLEGYLADLGTPPVYNGENFELCRRYWWLRPRDAEDVYYREHLLPHIRRQCRNDTSARWHGWRPTRLVLVVSMSRNLIQLTAEVLEPAQCLLLYTPDDPEGAQYQHWAEELSELLSVQGIASQVEAIREGSYAALREQFGRKLGPFLRGVEPGQVALDMTAGKKNMSLVLRDVAPPGSHLIYCQHCFRNFRPDPGTELFERWAVE